MSDDHHSEDVLLFVLVPGAPNRPLRAEVSGDHAQTSTFLLRDSCSNDLRRRTLVRHFHMRMTATRITTNAPSTEYDTTSCAVMVFSTISSSPNGHILIMTTKNASNEPMVYIGTMPGLFVGLSLGAHYVLTHHLCCREVPRMVNLVDFCRFVVGSSRRMGTLLKTLLNCKFSFD